jgi:hypothetical protein
MNDKEHLEYSDQIIMALTLAMSHMSRNRRHEFMERVNAMAARLDFVEDPEINATETNLDAAN